MELIVAQVVDTLTGHSGGKNIKLFRDLVYTGLITKLTHLYALQCLYTQVFLKTWFISACASSAS